MPSTANEGEEDELLISDDGTRKSPSSSPGGGEGLYSGRKTWMKGWKNTSSSSCLFVGRRLHYPFTMLLVALSLIVLLFILFYVGYFDEYTTTSSSSSSSSPTPPPPFFRRHPFTASIDCQRVIKNDTFYIKEVIKERVNLTDPADPDELPMDCEIIKRRHYFPVLPSSDEEAQFPWAEVRMVFEDYLYLEMMLAATYAPQNFYCYSLDKRSSFLFRRRLHSLANCFPNVLIPLTEYPRDSSGHHMVESLLECLRLLTTPEKHWHYVIALQNHDVILRTNKEMVKVLKAFDGANDVKTGPAGGGRISDDTLKLDWSFEGLHMFMNATRNSEKTFGGFEPRIEKFAGCLFESSLSRPFADFLIGELNLTEFTRRMEMTGFGADEQYIATLNSADSLDAPGGFTQLCMNKGENDDYVTRRTFWGGCESPYMRHSICVWGVEDLPKNARDSPFLYANKMMPEFDFGAISCWCEELHNRTYLDGEGKERVDEQFYAQMPHVRFQKVKREARARRVPVNIEDFNCTHGRTSSA